MKTFKLNISTYYIIVILLIIIMPACTPRKTSESDSMITVQNDYNKNLNENVSNFDKEDEFQMQTQVSSEDFEIV